MKAVTNHNFGNTWSFWLIFALVTSESCLVLESRPAMDAVPGPKTQGKMELGQEGSLHGI